MAGTIITLSSILCDKLNVPMVHCTILLDRSRSRSPGGGVLPIMAYMGKFRPKGVPSTGCRYVKGWGNLSFGSVKGPKGLTDKFYSFTKWRKRSIFLTDSYLNDSAFTTVKMVARY